MTWELFDTRTGHTHETFDSYEDAMIAFKKNPYAFMMAEVDEDGKAKNTRWKGSMTVIQDEPVAPDESATPPLPRPPGERKPPGEEQSSSFLFFETLLDSAEDAHPGSKKFYNAIIEAALLHSQKQRDYGRTEDPFANVRAAEEWGIPGWVGAMIRANDKIRRLQTFAVKGTLANEGVRDSFLDLAVYSLIALVLYEEEQREQS